MPAPPGSSGFSSGAMTQPAMAESSDRSFVPLHRRLRLGCALFCVTTGALVSLAWILGLEVPEPVRPGWVPMRPNAALVCILGGLALWALEPESTARWRRRFALACGLAMAAIGAATLAEHAFGLELGIDGLIVPGAADLTVVLRIPALICVASTLLGAALVLTTLRIARTDLITQGLVISAAVVAVGALCSAIYLTPEPGGAGVGSRAAVHGALGIFALGLGTLSTWPGRGLAGLLLGDTIGGLVARRLLPAAIVLPILIGWLRLKGSEAGLYGEESGVAIMSVVLVVLLLSVVLETTRALTRVEAERQTALQANEEIRRRSAELADQNRQFEESSRAKSLFLANMSHELRTPLNAILGFSELIHDETVGPLTANQKEYLGDILESARHLLALINDLLDLAKVEAGRLEFRPEPADLGRIVQDLAGIVGKLAIHKGVQVVATVDPAVRDAVIDVPRFKQVLYNYLSNAVKFSHNGGRVDVRILPESTDMFRLEVVDRGIGIRSEDLGRLFNEFQQLDSQAAHEPGGTGLGLALTRRLVEAQGGHVSVRSTHGEGSVFSAVLPRQGAAIRVDTATSGSEPPAPVAGTILIIDDQDQDRQVLERILLKAGYAVVPAGSWAQAQELGGRRTFDAITLDPMLRDGNGPDLVRTLRAGQANRRTPVIVVSAIPHKEVLADLPLHDVLGKPVEPEALLASLSRAGLKPLERPLVLIVDDDLASLQLTELFLGQLDCRTVCQANPELALTTVTRQPPAAIVLDLRMPGLDGFEFLEKVRSQHPERRIPVLVWTAHRPTTEEEARLRSLQATFVLKAPGADQVLIEHLKEFFPIKVDRLAAA